MSTLERAIEIAAKAHAGRRDKGGAPYILHPLRVMLRMPTEAERIVAVLHDVVEDTGWTIEALRREGFSDAVLEAIDSVTRVEEESYEDFVERAAKNPIGKAVKLADLEDNCDLSRIAEPKEADFARILKYLKAIARLRGPTSPSTPQDPRIPRDLARQLGHEAVEAIRDGAYTAPSGRRVEIRHLVELARRGTVSYPPERRVEPPPPRARTKAPVVEVVNETTLSAARRLIARRHRPVALNFASATEPGGGFLTGARAQEEYLARSSGLWECLRHDRMYDVHLRMDDPFYSDWVIYSPDVPVFRADDHQFLEDPYVCSIVTSPAVMAKHVERHQSHRLREIEGAMRTRVEKVLGVSAAHGHRALVLGAWGCGAFGNDGRTIAGLFGAALRGPFRGAFDEVVFAIVDGSDGRKFIGPFEREFA